VVGASKKKKIFSKTKRGFEENEGDPDPGDQSHSTDFKKEREV